ncbi:hypothetical protein TL16_g01588 [Triparma laevis f. inornata]|uniref:ODAD1 central coiled coil region domain-containing protein n=1 Tax=Triparma laevis f. inornata TaxID=1714386 RepID=A0A9W6ZJQ0_9STRA|nr:hypothetical protein TL16_g01588 [Triparma laevis f. inornata]
MTTEQKQSDLSQLQREYRHMEANRKAYAEESHQVLRKQQQTIDKLRRDNDTLKTEIAMQMRTTLKPANTFQQSMIEKLHDQMDKYSKQIETEKNAIGAMDDAIAVLRDKIFKERKNMGGVNAARDNQQMIQKQIRILENRLDKALVKFNQSLAHNRKLREQIDDLRRERVVFDNIYKKLEKELHEKKKQMAHVIELSNMTYEQRDNCQMEITAIDQANRKEQEDFEEQMIELGRMLEQDFKLQSSKSTSALKSTGKTPTKTTKKRVEATKEKIDAQMSMERVQNFEEAFNKIKAATGINDIEELVRMFIKNEDQNFSLFNYVNEQTNEIEKLEEQVLNLRKEEAKYSQESGDDVINQHKQILKELETKLQVSENQAEKFEFKCNNAQKTIESLKRGIQTMFEKLECKSDMLADSTVTEANMLQFLGIIEQRTNEILAVYHQIQSKQRAAMATMDSSKGAATPNVLGLGPTIPMGQDLIHVNPPKLEEFSEESGSDDDDDDAKPLTRDELKNRTFARIHKRADQKSTGKKKKGGR